MTREKIEIDHLVLCVHGIGNQVAGETVDDVLSGAVEEHNRKGQPPVVADETIIRLFETPYADYVGQSKVTKLPYPGGNANATIEAPVHTPKSHEQPQREGMQTKFPMHVKRIRKQGAPHKEIKTVMAEVYWADLSKEPKGAFATIFDLIKVVMSVGYLALDNAANTGSKSGYSAVVWFLWAIIGGVVALNAALLMGVLVLLLEGWVLDFGKVDEIVVDTNFQKFLQIGSALLAGVTLLLGMCSRSCPPGDGTWRWLGFLLICVILLGSIGVFALPPAEAVFTGTGALTVALAFATGVRNSWWELSLWRMFSTAASVWGLLILISIPFIPEASEAVAYCNERIITLCPFRELDPAEEQQLRFFIGGLMFLLQLAWAISVFCCFFVYLTWLKNRDPINDSGPANRQRRMFAPICSALLLLWMLVASSAWVVVQNAVNGVEDRLEILREALRDALEPLIINMAAAVFFLIVLLIVAAVVVVARIIKKNVLFKTTTSASWMGRLLFNWTFQVVFAVSTLAFFVIAADLILSDALSTKGIGAVNAFRTSSLEELARVVPYVLFGLAILVYQMRGLVAGGLGAFRDVVVYANNNKLDPTMSGGNDLSNFPPRKQIEDRFETVAKFMMSQVTPKRITIISHSQGTVVATRSLRRLLPSKLFAGCEVTLVTMGSPVTHLYRKYFPEAFRIEKGDFENDKKPIKWFNIGRTDDFVGTYIENLDEMNGLTKPKQEVPSKRNLLVPAGGHPGYFTDPYVWQHYSTKIGFDLL